MTSRLLVRLPVPCVALLLILTAAAPASAEDGLLTVGDRAPRIDIAHWVKGEESRGLEPNKVYVLEFWATWCGPCVAGMSHLSELQAKYADQNVAVIGVSDEPLPKVVEFLFRTNKADDKLQNDRILYALTCDPDRSVYDDYMKAAAQISIPTAFLIGKEGRIEWIGQPQDLDEPLKAVVAGTWDRATFKAEFAEKQAKQRKIQIAYENYKKHAEAKDWEAAGADLDQLILIEEDYAGWSVRKFQTLAAKMNAYDRAYAFAAKAIEHAWADGEALNSWAYMIADDESLTQRDLDLAMKAADRAKELTKGEDAAVLDTVARVFYAKGDYKAALEWQRKAIEHVDKDGTQFAELSEHLKEYEEKSK